MTMSNKTESAVVILDNGNMVVALGSQEPFPGVTRRKAWRGEIAKQRYSSDKVDVTTEKRAIQLHGTGVKKPRHAGAFS
jgi:hypothetical protein